MISHSANVVSSKLRVGLLGFGSLGQYLYETINSDSQINSKMEVHYVWNRTTSVLDEYGVPLEKRLDRLEDAPSLGADIVVEVSHPIVSQQLAVSVMQNGGNFVVGSPTALADRDTELSMRHVAAQGNGHGALYIPVGALIGASDLQSLSNRNALSSLTITMKKHPAMFNLNCEKLRSLCARMLEEEADCKSSRNETLVREQVLFEGPVRELCPKAPNNVNTMACAAMAAHSIGFDGTIGRLVADSRLTTHEVELFATGPPNASGQCFKLHICRSSPAPVGAVTSKATYGSFLESIVKCHGLGPGVHFV